MAGMGGRDAAADSNVERIVRETDEGEAGIFNLFEKSVFYGVEFVESRRCAELRRAFIESVPRGNDSLSRPQRVLSVSNSAALFTHNLFVVLSLGRRREPSSNPPRNDPSNFERRL